MNEQIIANSQRDMVASEKMHKLQAVSVSFTIIYCVTQLT